MSVRRNSAGLAIVALLAACGGKVTRDSAPTYVAEAGGSSGGAQTDASAGALDGTSSGTGGAANDGGSSGGSAGGSGHSEASAGAGQAGAGGGAGAGQAGAGGGAGQPSDECAACATRCVDDRCLVVAETAAGGANTCVRTTEGTVWCWGYNTRGEVGDGTTEHRLVPTRVEGLTGVRAVAVGGSHACALMPDRTVRCWGHNYYGQLGDGTDENRLMPVEVPGLAEVAQVEAGTAYTCALLLDGTVRCWGNNDRGQLGDDTTRGLWSPFVVPGLTDVAQVAAGSSNTCALMRDQTLQCWGSNRYGALGNGTIPDCEVGGSYPNYFPGCDYLPPGPVAGLTDVVQIELYGLRSCARTAPGDLWCFGLLLGPEVSMTATPQQVAGLEGVEQVGLGLDHTCVRLQDGTVRCWGENEHGQLGIGTDEQAVWTPTEVVGLADVVELSVGGNHNCALLRSGHVLCWGANDAGALGDGSQVASPTPTPVLWE